MERRHFVKSGVLAGMSIGILPFSLVANGINEKRISSSIISAENHVRHGHFNDDVGDVHQLTEWLRNFKKDVFHKNGISASNEDMINLSFEMNGQKIKVHKLGKNILSITDNGSERYDLDVETKITLYEDANFDCKIISFEKNHTTKLNQTHCILPLDNVVTFQDIKITDNEIVFVDQGSASIFNAGEDQMEIKAMKKEAIILTITKK